MSIKVSKSIADRATKDVQSVLNQLSGTDVRELLESSGGAILFDKPDDPATQAQSVATWTHFMELGLATKLSESELANRSKTDRANYSLGFQTTELYPRVRDTTVEFTVQAITEATGIKAPPRAKSAP